MSTIERLTELLASQKLSIEEKQTIKDVIRLILALQAENVALHEARALAKKGGAQ